MSRAGQPCAVSRTWVLSLAGIRWTRARCSLGLHNIFETQSGNFKNLFERGLNFLFTGVFQANTETVENRLLLVKARANHKREAEFLAVLPIELLKDGDFIRREAVQSRAGLFGIR